MAKVHHPPDAVPQLPHPGASGVAPAFMRLWQFFHKSATLSGLFRTAMFFLFARYAFCYTKTPLIKWFADLLGRFPKTLLHTQDTSVFIFNSLPLQSAICFFLLLNSKIRSPEVVFSGFVFMNVIYIFLSALNRSVFYAI